MRFFSKVLACAIIHCASPSLCSSPPPAPYGPGAHQQQLMSAGPATTNPRPVRFHPASGNPPPRARPDPFKTLVPSRYSFNHTRRRWESAIPHINYTYRDLLHAGDVEGARAALEALPPLSLFIDPPRDFGMVLAIYGEEHRRRAVAYEVGNPLVTSRVSVHALSTALFAPWRVLLLEDDVDAGRVKFEFDSPVGVWGQFGIREVDRVAAEFEDTLNGAIYSAAGWGADGEWEA